MSCTGTNRLSTRRRGTTLVELLVSLPLAILAAAAACLLLVRLAQSTRQQSSVLSASRELRHATQILAADIEPLHGRDLTSVSDTVLDFRGTMGVLTLCQVLDAHTIVAAGVPDLSDVWVGGLRAGDVVRVWRPEAPALPPTLHQRVLSAAPQALAPLVCTPYAMDRPTRGWRLSFADSLAVAVTGSPLSVHRDVRFRHYRSGATWWLGRQTRDGDAWETIQPVVGPLRSPATGAVRFEPRDRHGASVRVDAGTADSVRERVALLHVTLVMGRRTAGAHGRDVDSATVAIPLRADASRHR